MGKTDRFIIPIYKKFINPYIPNEKTALFGFTEDDKLSRFFPHKDCYDLRLGNWDINSGHWDVGKKYRVIVCLRTSGFALDPNRMLHHFWESLADGGTLIIDWSMGSDHYPRDDPRWTWSWSMGGKRCYGTYNKKKCFLHSSCLTNKCVQSKAFRRISEHAEKLSHYRGITDWQKTVTNEFGDDFLVDEKELLRLFDVETEKNWTPIDKNNRAQLYTIQTLRKKNA